MPLGLLGNFQKYTYICTCKLTKHTNQFVLWKLLKSKEKEIPAAEYCDKYGYGSGYGRRDVNGKANAGLTLVS